MINKDTWLSPCWQGRVSWHFGSGLRIRLQSLISTSLSWREYNILGLSLCQLLKFSSLSCDNVCGDLKNGFAQLSFIFYPISFKPHLFFSDLFSSGGKSTVAQVHFETSVLVTSSIPNQFITTTGLSLQADTLRWMSRQGAGTLLVVQSQGKASKRRYTLGFSVVWAPGSSFFTHLMRAC